FSQCLETLVESPNMIVAQRKLILSFIQARVQSQRATIFIYRILVRKLVGGCPQKAATSLMSDGRVLVQVERFRHRHIGLLLPLLLPWRKQEEPPNVRLRQFRMGRGEGWIQGYGALQRLDGGLIVILDLA